MLNSNGILAHIRLHYRSIHSHIFLEGTECFDDERCGVLRFWLGLTPNKFSVQMTVMVHPALVILQRGSDVNVPRFLAERTEKCFYCTQPTSSMLRVGGSFDRIGHVKQLKIHVFAQSSMLPRTIHACALQSIDVN